jgi:hypothetical protein
MIKLFLTSFLQIGLVAINTILLARGYVVGIFLASFTISLIWTFNVQKISVSKLKHKVVYALGAGFGAITGYFIINQFI